MPLGVSADDRIRPGRERARRRNQGAAGGSKNRAIAYARLWRGRSLRRIRGKVAPAAGELQRRRRGNRGSRGWFPSGSCELRQRPSGAQRFGLRPRPPSPSAPPTAGRSPQAPPPAPPARARAPAPLRRRERSQRRVPRQRPQPNDHAHVDTPLSRGVGLRDLLRSDLQKYGASDVSVGGVSG